MMGGLAQYMNRPVQAEATEHPDRVVLRQYGAPDLQLVFSGMDQPYDDRVLADNVEMRKQCIIRHTVHALAGVPAMVVRALPANMRILVVGSYGEYAWARYIPPSAPDESPRYEVEVPLNAYYPCDLLGPSALRHDKGNNQDKHLSALLIHEFAHILDFRFGVTKTLGGGDHHGEFWDVVHEGRENPTAYISGHASRDPGENFAETLVAWLAYRSGRIGGSYPLMEYEGEHIESRMCRELEWWDARAVEAATSTHGALWLGKPLAPRAILYEVDYEDGEGTRETSDYISSFGEGL